MRKTIANALTVLTEVVGLSISSVDGIVDSNDVSRGSSWCMASLASSGASFSAGVTVTFSFVIRSVLAVGVILLCSTLGGALVPVELDGAAAFSAASFSAASFSLALVRVSDQVTRAP